MNTFLKENGKMLLIGLGGVILGVFLNTMVRKQHDKDFLNTLKTELVQLQDKEKYGSLSDEEKQQLSDLKREILVMKLKCS